MVAVTTAATVVSDSDGGSDGEGDCGSISGGSRVWSGDGGRTSDGDSTCGDSDGDNN
jgi:hypothetical protein